MIKTKEEALSFIRRFSVPPCRTLEGKEKEQILLLLKMAEPFKEINNQRSWTEYYMIGKTEYRVSIFPDDDMIIDEMLYEA